MQTNEPKVILLKYPTRQRQLKFFENLINYLNKASGKHQIRVVVSMDTDDTQMNNQEVRDALNSLCEEDLFDIRYFYGESLGKINAINRDIGTDNWNILVSTADDMEPVEDGWDDIIVQDMMREFPNLDGALNYNTDPRLEDKGADGYKTLITLPVMGRKLYDKFGYIYHPDYKSEWCDNEQTEVFETLGVLRHINRRPIVHKFVPFHDELMTRNMGIGWNVDRHTFIRRKEGGFK
jgi:hypothetical protein